MAEFATNLPTVPYNPNQGMQTLQGILGIQAQRLDIQKGQQDLRTAQAGADQAQQKNRELTNLASFTQKAVQDPSYKMPDGSPNIAKFQNDAMAVAPVYGQDSIGKVTENFRSAVNTRRDLQSLSNDQNKALSGFFQSVAGMDNPTHDDILNAASQARANNTDPGFNRALDRALMNFDPTLGPADIRKRAGVAANTLGGMTGVTPGTVQTPGGTQGTTQSNYTGAITQAGAPVQGPPHQTTNAVGQIVNVTPSGKISVAPTTAPDANPTTAQATVRNTAAAGVANRVQQAQAAANNTVQAQDALTRARTILDSPNAPNTGALVDWKRNVKNFLSSAGIDTEGADDTNSLVKNLARYEAARATQAGLGGTDAARELAHNGSPNVSIDNAALKGIVTQSLATEKALAAYANVQSRTTDGGKLGKNEGDFRSIPRLIEGYEYGLARTPQEAEEFLKKHGISRADMARTRQMIKEFEGRQ